MKNCILLFICFRLTCSCMLGLFLWVARSHGGHVADGDLIGEYRIVRHSLELNHSVTKITTFICIHLCFSRDNMHLWIKIATRKICYEITISMSVNFIVLSPCPSYIQSAWLEYGSLLLWQKKPYGIKSYRWKILRSTNPETRKAWLFINNCFELPSDWLSQ